MDCSWLLLLTVLIVMVVLDIYENVIVELRRLYMGRT